MISIHLRTTIRSRGAQKVNNTTKNTLTQFPKALSANFSDRNNKRKVHLDILKNLQLGLFRRTNSQNDSDLSSFLPDFLTLKKLADPQNLVSTVANAQNYIDPKLINPNYVIEKSQEAFLNKIGILEKSMFASNNPRLSKVVETALHAAGGGYMDAQVVSDLGDLTSFYPLLRARERMLEDPVGREILLKQPRIWNFETLSQLKKNYEGRENTVGAQYLGFMTEFDLDPSGRPLVRYIPDYELAYIMQRYKEIHDFIHVFTGHPDISLKSELLVKYFEMIHFGFPSALLSFMMWPKLLKPSEYRSFLMALPKLAYEAENCRFLMNVKFEECLDMDMGEFRDYLGINL